MSKESKSNQDAKKQGRTLVEELIDDNFESNVLESLKGRWAENAKELGEEIKNIICSRISIKL